MPTTWNRTPEEFHKIYTANTDAFYRAGSAAIAPELDKFITKCALGLWSKAGTINDRHVDMANEIYSHRQPKPDWLLWNLVSSVGESDVFLPPLFFWDIAENDAKRGTETSRTFIRMLTNILLYLAATDDDVTLAEAEYITDCTDKLSAICDSNNVKNTKKGLNPLDYITSGEPPLIEKYQSAGSPAPAAKGEKPAENGEAPKYNFDEVMAELDGLVGLDEVKKEVRSLMNLTKVRKLRKDNGLPVPAMSMHMVFMGNPGTGKTTVARLISKLYASIGALSKGQLVECDRSSLVAGYVGQTAIQTQKKIQEALGGVLFIDEAYSLSSGGENDFGREAIETILKGMEDHRDELVVIVAGYTGPMTGFINSNPGLESRFNKYIYFNDYVGEQLFKIFENYCKKNSYTMTDESREVAEKLFNMLYEERDDNFGNARDVRNRFEDMITRQANRVAALESPTTDDLVSVLPEDILDEDELEEFGITVKGAEEETPAEPAAQDEQPAPADESAAAEEEQA